MTDKRHVVARAADIPEGERLIVTVEGVEIGIFNVDGRYHAILNRCPHRDGELCKGDVISLVLSDGPGDVRLDKGTKFIACPWHGWEYDLETGQSWYDPSEGAVAHAPARRFGLEVRSGADVAHALSEGTVVAASEGGVVDRRHHRVRGPYRVDVFAADVEDDYIVVSLRPLRRPAADGRPGR